VDIINIILEAFKSIIKGTDVCRWLQM